MTTLLIDDLRNFRDKREATVMRNSASALDFLQKNSTVHFNEIWLDHDLGKVDGNIDTIMPVVDYLCERSFNDNPVNVDLIYIHTSNPVGAKQMVAGLERYGYTIRKVQAGIYFTV